MLAASKTKPKHRFFVAFAVRPGILVVATIGAVRRYLFVAFTVLGGRISMMKFCASCIASFVRFAVIFCTSQVIHAAALLAVLFLASPASAVTLFWDANSSLAGSGTWDVNTTTNWSTTNV